MSERVEKIRERLREIASRSAAPVEAEPTGIVVKPGEPFTYQPWTAPKRDFDDEADVARRRRAGVEAFAELERQKQERRDAD